MNNKLRRSALLATAFTYAGGVVSSGTFVKNKNATWYAIGENGIPYGWTVQIA